MELLHIGLGKYVSTFLQKEIFPKLAKKYKVEFINLYNNNNLNTEKINFLLFKEWL
jgi:hypothetical protein